MTTIPPNRDEATQGFVSLPVLLKDDEYISYQEENGDYTLISNFGTTEVECQITCRYQTYDDDDYDYDDDDQLDLNQFSRRRKFQFTVKKVTLIFVVTSLAVAVILAERKMKDECEQLEKETAEEFIGAVADDCGSVFSRKNEEWKKWLDCTVKVKCNVPRYDPSRNDTTSIIFSGQEKQQNFIEVDMKEREEYCLEQGWEYFDRVDLEIVYLDGSDQDEENLEDWLVLTSIKMVHSCEQLGCSNHIHSYICKNERVSYTGQFEYMSGPYYPRLAKDLKPPPGFDENMLLEMQQETLKENMNENDEEY